MRRTNGVENDEYGIRIPAAYAPTGTHRDVVTARDSLQATLQRPEVMAALREGFDGAWQGEGFGRMEQRWVSVVYHWLDAVTGSLMWISEDIARGIDRASDTYPEPSPGYLDTWELPDHGIALTQSPIFDRTMDGRDLVVNTAGASVAGVMWSKSAKGLAVTPLAAAAGLSLHGQRSARAMGLDIMPLIPVGVTGRPPFSGHVVNASTGETVDSSWPHAGYHWFRFILSLNAWTSQVAEVEDHEVRAARTTRTGKGKAKRPPKVGDVRVVKLRRPARRSSDSPKGEGPGRTYSVRWVVGGDTGGFWRNQPCGPRQSERRPVWISPYVKGPEDAPLVARTTVLKVDR